MLLSLFLHKEQRNWRCHSLAYAMFGPPSASSSTAYESKDAEKRGELMSLSLSLSLSFSRIRQQH
jgi:hypothetical protein